jgi:hypothetical protein
MIDHAERAHREELARRDADLADFAEKYRELQDQNGATEQQGKEQQARDQEILEDLARLRFAAPSPTGGEPPPRPQKNTEQPHESLPGELETAGQAVRSEFPHGTPVAARSTSDDELEAARAQVEDLKRQLADAERVQTEMAAILGGMGISVRQV